MRPPLALLLLLATASRAAAAEPVTFPAADARPVHAIVYRAQAKTPSGVILLFHQAGANKSEYAPIAPELARLGWTAIAVDQRSGGSLFGGRNETAGAGDPPFLSARADLEGALTYAHREYVGQKVVAWGSSYSAALVFLLAAAHPDDVAALLSFSPGEYLPGTSVRTAATHVHVPVFITSAADAAEIAEAKALYDAVPASSKIQFVPRQGVHGSATLRHDSNPQGEQAAWVAVEHFLADVAAH